MIHPEYAAGVLWIAFVVVWQALALWTARAVKRGAAGSQVGWFIGYAVGFGLLFGPFFQPREKMGVVAEPLWAEPAAVGWLLIAAQAALFAFAFWARRHLGLLWSGMLTLREGHRVIDTGPYRLVRHPIYTGFIGASWTMALVGAEPERLLGAALLTVVMASKAKVEERLLRQELGEGDYDAYAAKTPMIIPFSPV